jgi:hypothetical protein
MLSKTFAAFGCCSLKAAVKRHIANHIRKQSWAIAALFLIAFCWLGFAAVATRALLKGMEVNLAGSTSFAVAYGPIAFPLIGVVAATALILSDVLVRHRWVQGALAGLFALLIIWALEGTLGGIFTLAAQSGLRPNP